VLTGLKIWVSKAGSKEEITDAGLVAILEPKLLGILVHFDNVLNNGTVPIAEKKDVSVLLSSVGSDLFFAGFRERHQSDEVDGS
jgi:hypothetical protein